MKWFFTFGTGHMAGSMNLANRYVVIEGEFSKAREKLCAVRGPRWSFQYDIGELEGMKARFGLEEITLEELSDE